MNLSQAVQSGFKHYIRFSGRASRSEYWYWALFVLLVSLAMSVISGTVFDGIPAAEIIERVVSLVLFMPGIMVGIRRLHDVNRSGWWCLISFTIIGIIPLIIWACMKGTEGNNRFGPDPLAGQ